MLEKPFERVHLLVLDGVGCGHSADAAEKSPKDVGANSIVHASKVVPLYAPTMQSMGLERISGCEELRVASGMRREVRGAFGSLEPTFAGTGSPEGHIALCGYTQFEPLQYFDADGFPPELVMRIEQVAREIIGREVKTVRYPGTDDISGTTFIDDPRIYAPHLKSSDPSKPFTLPIYASSDSLVQIAYHQDVLPQALAENLGHAVRRMLDRDFRVGRVILRPFVGVPGAFKRVSADRHDYGTDPDKPTLIDHLAEAGVSIHGIGKFPDMLNFRGFKKEQCQKLNNDFERGWEIVRRMKGELRDNLVVTNLVGCDELYGHRRNPAGYAGHVGYMDQIFEDVLKAMKKTDLFIVTSDHGNDPTHMGTNHTRERTPLLAASPRIERPIDLGIRKTYADVAATIADIFGVKEKLPEGASFLQELLAA